jgi:hypothetical protein
MSKIDFRDPAQNLRAFVKLMGDLDPSKAVYSWFGGHIFGYVGNKPAQMLCGVEGFGVLRSVPTADGKYRIMNREIAFYSNPFSGQYVDVWKNPLTGEDCEVQPIHNHYVAAELSPVMKMDFEGTMREFPFTPPWTVLGADVFQVFEVHTAYPSPMKVAQWPRESSGDVIRISEIFQRTARLAEIEDESRTSAHYTGTWTRVGPWLPWMLMGQAEGHILYRTFMKKLYSVDELPAQLRDATAKRYPEFFEAPALSDWGKPNDSSWGTYMKECRPRPPRA